MTTTNIKKRYESASIIAVLYKGLIGYRTDSEDMKLSMSIMDASVDFDTLIYISKIEVPILDRGRGYGSQALKQFCNEYKGIPIILEAGFLYEQDYNSYLTTRDTSTIIKLVSFYRKNGFLDVNDRYGCYGDRVTMLNFNM